MKTLLKKINKKPQTQKQGPGAGGCTPTGAN